MINWFTIEIIDDKTYVFSEYGHYEETHAYLLNGRERSLLIDSGMGIANIRDIIESYTDCSNLSVIATHAHWDHTGGHALFNDVYVHEREYSWVTGNFPLPQSIIIKSFEESCFLNKKPEWFDAEQFMIYNSKEVKQIKDHHIFDLGGRIIECLHTPGHSPGHLCFFDETNGYLFSGDILYKGTIFLHYPSTDPVLGKQSVDRLAEYKNKIFRILPGHHSLNIQTALLDELSNLLEMAENTGQLCHGAGIFRAENIAVKM